MNSLPTVSSVLRVRLGTAALGLPSTAVREVLRAVAITKLAGAPPIIEGMINVRGEVVPVIDVRRRLGLAPAPLDPDQFMVVFHAGSRVLALRVDDVDDLTELDGVHTESPDALSPALRGLTGLSAGPEGVLVIHDPDAFVSQAEAEALDALLASST